MIKPLKNERWYEIAAVNKSRARKAFKDMYRLWRCGNTFPPYKAVFFQLDSRIKVDCVPSELIDLLSFLVKSLQGGTSPTHHLNLLGRRKSRLRRGETGGDILLWKRRSERYLVRSGLTYTIVHPGTYERMSLQERRGVLERTESMGVYVLGLCGGVGVFLPRGGYDSSDCDRRLARS